MTYEETVAYLYASAPLFQQVGGAAYKEGLTTTHLLDAHFGHPHRRYTTIHVAGTNGKGSCAHTLAAMCQAAGLRTGLYTSPHLVDFRERIRVNGQMIPREAVVRFVQEERAFFEPLHPSFFELTTALALNHFAQEQVDVAIIEVGLGGRLDCTNIITPALSVITNISLDHTQFLGHTLEAIAAEKAGIIKAGVPVVVGEALEATRPVFVRRAADVGAPITFAQDHPEVIASDVGADGLRHYATRHFGDLQGQLAGDCQVCNANTILTAARMLADHGLLPQGDALRQVVAQAFRHVCDMTGLMGRWQVVGNDPLVVCDTGHNIGGWQYLANKLSSGCWPQVHVVFGMMADKDVDHVLQLLPKQARYYFTQASVRRSMDAETLLGHARRHGLDGVVFARVPDAVHAAVAQAGADDLVFIGGSSFVVADYLASRPDLHEN